MESFEDSKGSPTKRSARMGRFEIGSNVSKGELELHLRDSKDKICTIFLIDDHPQVLETGARMLRALGYGVLTARNGEQAVKFFKECREMICLVIVDRDMPGMNGGEVCKTITEIDPDISTILVSGGSLGGEAEKYLESGKCAFLKKPFDLKTLSRTISDLLYRPGESIP